MVTYLIWEKVVYGISLCLGVDNCRPSTILIAHVRGKLWCVIGDIVDVPQALPEPLQVCKTPRTPSYWRLCGSGSGTEGHPAAVWVTGHVVPLTLSAVKEDRNAVSISLGLWGVGWEVKNYYRQHFDTWNASLSEVSAVSIVSLVTSQWVLHQNMLLFSQTYINLVQFNSQHVILMLIDLYTLV